MSNYTKGDSSRLDREMPNRYETVKTVSERRNRKLLAFFSKVTQEVSIIGDPEKPAIIINNQFCLSAYVDNFYLNFTDQPEQGEILRTYKLKVGTYITQKDMDDFISDYKHREMFKIKLENTDLFLAGYNFLDREKSEGKFPVFSKHKYKLYFNKASALDIIEDFSDEYELILI